MSSKSKKNNTEKLTVETLGLISWYTTGWLSANERASIKKQLEENPELKQYLTEEQMIIDLVTKDKSVLELSALETTEKRLENVIERIKNTPQEENSNLYSTQEFGSSTSINPLSKLNHFIQSLISGEASSYQYTGFAGAIVLVALLFAFTAPMISPFLENNENISFQPATVKVNKTESQLSTTELLVGISVDTIPSWLDALLQKNHAKMVKVLGKDGLYRISLDKQLSKAEVESLLDQLNSHKDTIWFSGEAF